MAKPLKMLIFGMGCPSCKKLEENAKKAVSELGLFASVAKIADIEKIIEYRVTSTPALVIGNEIAFSGRVPSVNELKDILGGYA